MDDFRFPWAVDWGWDMSFMPGGQWTNGKAVKPAGWKPKGGVGKKSAAAKAGAGGGGAGEQKPAPEPKTAPISALKNSLSNSKISALTPRKATFKVDGQPTSGFQVGGNAAVYKQGNKWAYGSLQNGSVKSFGDVSQNFATKNDAVAGLKRNLREQSDFGK